MIDKRKIKSPEYADSKERMSELYRIQVDGREAEAVIKYADIFVEETQQELLDKIKKGQDYEQAALEYKVACRFMERLKFVANLAIQKEDTFQKLRHSVSPF